MELEKTPLDKVEDFSQWVEDEFQTLTEDLASEVNVVLDRHFGEIRILIEQLRGEIQSAT